MSDQIVIGVKDNQTANALQAELGALGIQVNRKSGSQAVSFGANFKLGPLGEINVPKEEIIYFVKEGPSAFVDGVFNALEKVRDRIELFINGKPTEISDWQKSLKNPH
jgi:hypothetical protein